MNSKQISIIKQQLTIKDGEPRVSSLTIAEAFGKQHKNVLRDIEALDCSLEFNRLNFEPVMYKDAKGEMRPSYEMTKDGFFFLVMGYTGEKAGLIKEWYIYAFNLLVKEINSAMVGTREAAVDATLAVVSEASTKGHSGSFIPLLVQYRRAGLSCSQVADILHIGSTSVSIWHRKIEAAGATLPKGGTVSSTTAHFKKRVAAPRQLSLMEVV